MTPETKKIVAIPLNRDIVVGDVFTCPNGEGFDGGYTADMLEKGETPEQLLED
jgi:hypothetical protein